MAGGATLIKEMRESELFPPLKSYFQTLGYAVYGEVPAPHGGYIDLLAIQNDVSVAVELKAFFSRQSVRQAGRNKRFVWESYVAVPAGARVPPRRRASLKRHGAGLLAVGETVATAVEARRVAPPCTVREAFGRHLSGELSRLYAAAEGGVPTVERVSAARVFAEKVAAALAARGGFANTDQLLADTLSWNYCRSKRGGLCWILEAHHKQIAPGLWAARRTRCIQEFHLDSAALIRTHLPDTFVAVTTTGLLPQTGDILYTGKQRRFVISAECHPVIETPQRELRAGPAVFFSWRLHSPLQLPTQALVLVLRPAAKA